MGVVAVYSPKGGVGKTTLAFDLAWRSATIGNHKTLLWDLDPEGGSAFLCQIDPTHLIDDPYLLQKPYEVRQAINLTHYDNLFFLGFGENVRAISFYLSRIGPKKRIEELVKNLSGTFDRIVLDCPPVRDELSEQVIRAADLMITPLPASPLALRALDKVKKEQKRIGRASMPLLPVFSMFDSRRKSHQIARETILSGFPVIPWSNDIERIAFKQTPINAFAHGSRGADALDKLWRGVEKKFAEIG